MAGKRAKKAEPKVDFGRALRFLWQFIGPIYKPVWWALIFLVFSIGIALVEPNVYRLTVDALTNGSQVDFVYVFQLLGLWALLSVLNVLVFSVYRLIFAYRLPRVDQIYYGKAFQVFFNLDVAKHLSRKAGEQMKKIDKGSDGIWNMTIPIAEDILPSWLTAVAMLILGVVISWQMTVVTLLMVPVYLLIFGYGSNKTGHLQDKIMNDFEKFWGNAHDLATNILVVKSYAREKFHLLKMVKQITEVSKKQTKVSVRWGALSTAGHMLGVFNRLVIFFGGIFLMSKGIVSLGTVIMFLSISGSIYGPLQGLGGQLRNFQKQCGYLNQVEKLFEEANYVEDSKNAKILKVKEGGIKLEKVKFGYEHLTIIDRLNLEIEPGKLTALVGHSGAGKSTVASLLSRFYDVTEGKILIDGQNLREVTQKSLREKIGLVMQDNSMFNDTIYNNIAYAKPGVSKAQVIAAAKAANIHDFIMSQPKGYQTLVGERGLKLSGGQKQRVAIARVILKDPPILILDEATSALDSASEKVVQEALEHVMKNRTSIVIAHRLSTVRKADKIVVLDKGRLVQQGTHAQLIKKPGIYKDLVDLQVNGLLAK
jgi:ABC-type multidrug transport system fused ATPase/permease subunit